MEEKRRNKRLELNAHLIMNRIDSGRNDLIPVKINNISVTGLGFTCKDTLEFNSTYEVEIVLWTKDVLHTFINIIRMDRMDGENYYGATFVGLTESEACKINIYDLFRENEGK